MSKKGLKKEAVIGSVQDSEPIAVTDEELALINKYTRLFRSFTAKKIKTTPFQTVSSEFNGGK